MTPGENREPFSSSTRQDARLAVMFSLFLLLGVVSVGQGQYGQASRKPLVPALDPQQVSRLVIQLDSRSFKVRRAATQQLLKGGLAIRPLLLRALRDRGISLEKKMRLRLIADQLLGFQMVARLDGKKAWDRLGYPDRMFVIDNAWDFERYRRVLPKLPKVDLQRKQLLVVISWDTRPRTLLQPTDDGEVLVVPVKEGPIVRESDEFIAPQIIVAQLAAWAGPMRFEVNGKPQYTLWKGKRRREEAVKQWQEIKRWYNGGKPTLKQRVAANRTQWGEGTSDKEIAAALAKKPVSRHERERLFIWGFQRLGDMRATAVVGEIFELVEKMKEFDPALGPAGHALTLIGGPEVIAGCEKTLKSKNPFAQSLAIGIACALGLPELRPLYQRALGCAYGPCMRGAMNGLSRIGWGKKDVPALMGVLKRIDSVRDGDEDIVDMAMFHLGSLGAGAAAALPALNKLKTHPSVYLRKSAASAVANIQGAIKRNDGSR